MLFIFIPIPKRAYSILPGCPDTSVKIPAIFLFSASTSFGHLQQLFIFRLSRYFLIPIDAESVIRFQQLKGRSGRRITVK